MKKFIESLPGFNGKYTIELVEIAFQHFMDGTEMYHDKEYSDGSKILITTQYGFKNEILNNSKIKMSEKRIDKMINDFNNEYVTPEEYRNLHIKYRELYDKYYHMKWIHDFKKKHPLKYLLHCKKLKEVK